MTSAKKTAAEAHLDDDFTFDLTACDAFGDDDLSADEWLNLPGDPSETIAHDMLKRALAEDPFATTHQDDCLPDWGATPVAFSRYLRASAAFIDACRAPEPDYEEQEIHRLIAMYWLKKSRPIWLD